MFRKSLIWCGIKFSSYSVAVLANEHHSLRVRIRTLLTGGILMQTLCTLPVIIYLTILQDFLCLWLLFNVFVSSFLLVWFQIAEEKKKTLKLRRDILYNCLAALSFSLLFNIGLLELTVIMKKEPWTLLFFVCSCSSYILLWAAYMCTFITFYVNKAAALKYTMIQKSELYTEQMLKIEEGFRKQGFKVISSHTMDCV